MADDNTGNPPPVAWTTGLDADLIGHAQTHGWDKLAADKAAQAALTAHREINKFTGVPVDRLVKLPAAGAQPAEWDSVYQRLGAPKEAKDYDFAPVKFKDGTALDQTAVDAIRAAAAKVHATKEGAQEIARSFIAITEAQEAAEAITSQAQALTERTALEASWGANSAAFKVVAERTASALGVDPAKFDPNKPGYADTMKLFYTIGTKVGEDSFIRKLPGEGGAIGALSKEQATARINDLKTDPDWQKRYFDKGEGSPEDLEMKALIKISRQS